MKDSRLEEKVGYLRITEEDKKQLCFEAGKADAESGYPPKESSRIYLDGYAEGMKTYQNTGITTWDKPF